MRALCISTVVACVPVHRVKIHAIYSSLVRPEWKASEKQSKPNLTTIAMPTFGIPSPMPHVPRCRTLKLVAQRRRKLEEKSPFPEQPTPTPAKHHGAQPLSKVTHLIIAHFDCRCRVCANARYEATNSCKSQGLLNCLATGFVGYGAGVER